MLGVFDASLGLWCAGEGPKPPHRPRSPRRRRDGARLARGPSRPARPGDHVQHVCSKEADVQMDGRTSKTRRHVHCSMPPQKGF